MDRRIRKSKEAIKQAYMHLRNKKPTGKITVTELAREADIDRKTFYLHYDSTESIVNEMIEERLEGISLLLNEIDFYNQPVRVNLALGAVHRLINEDIETYRRLAVNSEYSVFWQKAHIILVAAVVRAYREKVKVSEAELQMYSELFIGGLINTYIRWLKGELKMSLEEIGKAAVHLAENGIMDYVDE